MKLNDEQKTLVQENYKDFPDLIELTRMVFEDDSLDGRTKEGRAVRKFLVDNSLLALKPPPMPRS